MKSLFFFGALLFPVSLLANWEIISQPNEYVEFEDHALTSKVINGESYVAEKICRLGINIKYPSGESKNYENSDLQDVGPCIRDLTFSPTDSLLLCCSSGNYLLFYDINDAGLYVLDEKVKVEPNFKTYQVRFSKCGNYIKVFGESERNFIIFINKKYENNSINRDQLGTKKPVV
ncbi:MAG: hypothetical protein H6731_07580 [Myxococcales bacterium]|nr:MAG: hypothetical protein H6731_07580 [Myxococcales bacterium]